MTIINIQTNAMGNPRWEISHLIGDLWEGVFQRMTVEIGLEGKSIPLTRASGGKDSGVEQHRIPISLRNFAHLDAKPDK